MAAPADPPLDERPLTIKDLPQGVVPRLVNSLRFELHCDLGTATVEGIRAVELWGTRDGGAHWISFGETANFRAPLMMTVNGEGVFGFRLRVHAPAGPVGAPPQGGDLPDIWVVVDTTAPTARLTRVDFGQGAQAEQVSVGWEADDSRLAGRPISLDYASQPAGPWTAIATNLPNAGVYQWRTDARLPPRAYLRLSVRDEAGNATSVQTPEPVALPRANPTPRITDARAISHR